MAEYIERDAAINELDEWLLMYPDSDAAREALSLAKRSIKKLPAADVRPVVLCRDCVYSDKWYADRLICYLWNEHDGNAVFEDGFCNYGVKREGSHADTAN